MESKSHHSRLSGTGSPMASVTQKKNNLNQGYSNMKQNMFQKVQHPGAGNRVSSVNIKTSIG